MKILAVETATAWQSVAILGGKSVVARLDRDAQGSHARCLLPAIDRLLTSSGLRLTELDGLAVSIGPGSFTGLRVGLATMLGFRTVTGLPLVVVPTLEAMAWNLRGTAFALCPIIKSRTGEVYWGLYQWTDSETLVKMADERVGSPSAVASAIHSPTIVFGDGWEAYAVDIRRCVGERSELLIESPSSRAPSAVSVGLAGVKRLVKGEIAGIGVAPLYVQRSEAELNYDRGAAMASPSRLDKRLARRRALAQSGLKRTGPHVDGRSRRRRSVT
ncbi:MAG: tRNA (adenosine(37)-N6)-threonylcarbamoyltransferase complex dimerization subunit type 1 TsaB [Nitrospiraceae bacterium]